MQGLRLVCSLLPLLGNVVHARQQVQRPVLLAPLPCPAASGAAGGVGCCTLETRALLVCVMLEVGQEAGPG